MLYASVWNICGCWPKDLSSKTSLLLFSLKLCYIKQSSVNTRPVLVHYAPLCYIKQSSVNTRPVLVHYAPNAVSF
jgi:hypothetical protein